MKPAVWRFAGGLLLALAGVWAVYLAGMNALLRTHTLRRMISFRPDALLVEYRSASTILPGRVHVDDLRIRGRDGGTEWILTIDRCDFWFLPLDLLKRRFHADHVRGDGLSLRLRRRLVSPTARETEALPPIPGFPMPPLKGPPKPSLPDDKYDLWSIDLEDVVAAHVREVWVDSLRLAGELDIQGRWFFRPQRWLDIGPARVDVRELEGGRGMLGSLASGVRGHFETTVPPFDLRELDHGSFFPHLSVRGEISGTARLTAIADRALADVPLRAKAGDPQVVLSLDLDRGILRPGTWAETKPTEVTASTLQGWAALACSARWTARAEVKGVDGNLAVRAAGLHLSGPRGEEASVDDVVAVATTRDLDLSHPFEDASYGIDATGVQAKDPVAWLVGLVSLPPSVHLGSGPARATVHAEGTVESAARGEIAGTALVQVDGGSVSQGNWRITSDAAVDLHLARTCTPACGEDLSGSSLSLVHLAATPTYDARPLALVRQVVASTSSLGVDEHGLRGEVHVDVPEVVLSDMAALGRVVAMPENLDVQRGRAGASVRFDLDLATLRASGSAEWRATGLRAKLGDDVLAGQVFGHLRARSTADAVDLTGSTASFRPDDLGSWWVDLELAAGSLRLRPALEVRGRLTARAKDASPVKAMLAASSGIPSWVLGIVPLDRLNAGAVVRATARTLEVNGLRAEGGGTELELSYEKREAGDAGWVLMLERGLLHVGVRGGDGGTEVALFHVREWYDRQVAALRVAPR